MAFDQKKVAQSAAWFVSRAGGQLTILKLMKLLYLADRQAIAAFARPISGDRMVSMPHGPVLSQTLEVANGNLESEPEGWDSWLCDRAGREIALRPGRDVSREALDSISDAEFAILNEVQDRFGHMSAIALRDYTHRECPEWRDPNGSSRPIPLQRVLTVTGRSQEETTAIMHQVEEDSRLDRVFAAL